jgi:heterodisulfide reductase subunit C/nitrate reductase gamma subunit
MFTSYCAYFALAVCLLGTLWRVGRWFAIGVGTESRPSTRLGRVASAGGALLQVLFSRRIWAVLSTLAADVILQRRIFRQSRIRWVMHLGLFYGVLLLTLLHALDNLTLARWLDPYASTLNPFMLLRNLLGLLLLVGLLIALIRRQCIPCLKRFTSRADQTILYLCFLILLSGVALEAVQIISAATFKEMVADYMGDDDPEAIAALSAYWAQDFDVVFQDPPPADAASLALGRSLHADYCAVCHSRPTAAVLADPLAKAIKPLAGVIARIDLERGLRYFHFLAACLALAVLPFSKFFHLVSVPVNLAAGAAGATTESRSLDRLTRRAVGLDACTHCGVCSRHCSVAPIMTVIDNPDILPSEKIGSIRRMATGRLGPARLAVLAQGGRICTACGRCTEVCPSGIDLQDLWTAAQTDLVRQGFLPPYGKIGRRTMRQWAEAAKATAVRPAKGAHADFSLGLTRNPETFRSCVQCTTCTNVCPVVAASNNPREELDFTPQQVMNLMRLELKEMALGCGMVWKCVTCYLCQEHCPQGVPVADVLYELRNEACRRLVPAEIPLHTGEVEP